MVELLIQNRIYITAMMRTHGGLDLIVLIALTGMMLIQQNSILEMTQNLKNFFIQWNTSGESLSASKRISKSAHLLMSKMSARNLLTRLKRSDAGWIIVEFLQ